MAYRDRAIEVVAAAEASLRGVITEALEAQAYRDVAAIAGVADRIAAIVRELTLPAAASATVASVSDAGAPVQKAAPPPPPLRPQKFPYYVRDSDRLIKWAWSKKERKPYEHRAPRQIVEALLESIRGRMGEGKVFQASEVLPLSMPSGEEYPSYQAYVALGWLREVGVVTKRGRSGYVLAKGVGADRVDAFWQALPQVEERG